MRFVARIPALTKRNEQEHCRSGGTNLQCAISQDIFVAHLPIVSAKHLCVSVDSQIVPAGATPHAEPVRTERESPKPSTP
jgi:hypothetical protein